jgi:hypothetical protein
MRTIANLFIFAFGFILAQIDLAVIHHFNGSWEAWVFVALTAATLVTMAKAAVSVITNL